MIGTDASQFQDHAGQPYHIRAQNSMHIPLLQFLLSIIAGIGAGVGSSAAVLLLAIMMFVITTVVVKSKQTGNGILPITSHV